MSEPRIRVVGLGPAGPELVGVRAWSLVTGAPHVRLRTRRHPAAATLSAPSYDDWYDRYDTFEELYAAIAADLGRLATTVGDEVVYAVPGSPTVAERTVELLRAGAVPVSVEPAISVIDLACARLGYDPLRGGLRVEDALGSPEPLAGPGPVLLLQAYAPEILAAVAGRLDPSTPVTVLHHLGLDDEVVETLEARELARAGADHLTSLWVGELRTPGVALEELVNLVRTLRARCPWDREQTHGSLVRHLREEAYEAMDALEELAGAEPEPSAALVDHVADELGDVLAQILFHAELGAEVDRFDLTAIADRLATKLVARHPHVFGSEVAHSAEEVAAQWETWKRRQPGRTAADEGVAWDLPALALYEKVLRRVGSPGGAAPDERDDEDERLVDALEEVARQASRRGLDLEGALRERARRLLARAVEDPGPVAT